MHICIKRYKSAIKFIYLKISDCDECTKQDLTISDLRQSIIECRETIESKVLKIRQFETKIEMLQGVLKSKIHVLNLKI